MKSYIKILPALFVVMGFSTDSCNASGSYETFVNNMAGKKSNSEENLSNIKDQINQNIVNVCEQVNKYITNIEDKTKKLSKIKEFKEYNNILISELDEFKNVLDGLRIDGIYNENTIQEYIDTVSDLIEDCNFYKQECDILFTKASRNSKKYKYLYEASYEALQVIQDFIYYLQTLPGAMQQTSIPTSFG